MTSNQKKYHSLSHRCEENMKRYIEGWFSLEDKERFVSVNHICTKSAYIQILHMLSTIENAFYAYFDGRGLRKRPTQFDWKDFAIPKILETLNIMYTEQQYDQLSNEKPRADNNNYSDDGEQPNSIQLCTPGTAKIRILYANKIWREWSNERHWGPRVGVILISNVEIGAEKVLLVSFIKDNMFNYGFPKGKPNLGETIRMGSFRETKEETGRHDLTSILGINENNGIIIKKHPYIGDIKRRRCRTHYYVITSTSTQFTSFRPNKYEVLDVEWHSVYILPCCDDCKIRRNYIIYKNSKMPINYHMITLRDINGQNSAVLDILAYIDAKNGNEDAYNKYRHTHRECGNNLS